LGNIGGVRENDSGVVFLKIKWRKKMG
jgi:hypothetical protein